MKTIGDQLDEWAQAYQDDQAWREQHATQAGFLASPVPRDTWHAGLEVDALLAQLRGRDQEVRDVLDRMSLVELSAFGQVLWQLGRAVTDTALAQAHAQNRAAR